MKKLFLLPFVAMFGLVGCGGSDNPPAPGPGPSGDGLVAKYDFSTVEKGNEIASVEAANTLFAAKKVGGSGSVTVTEISKVYEGNATGGAYENQGGFLKLSTAKVDCSLKFTVSEAVVRVVINCHSFYKSSESYPTNTTNFIKVNTADAVAMPYNATATGEDVTFTVSGTEVAISTYNPAPSTNTTAGRGFVWSIAVYNK